MDNIKEIENFAKEERNAYFRNWRKNNKDKIKQYNANYWKNKAIKSLQGGEKTQNE